MPMPPYSSFEPNNACGSSSPRGCEAIAKDLSTRRHRGTENNWKRRETNDSFMYSLLISYLLCVSVPPRLILHSFLGKSLQCPQLRFDTGDPLPVADRRQVGADVFHRAGACGGGEPERHVEV